jgi:hypothetical protein
MVSSALSCCNLSIERHDVRDEKNYFPTIEAGKYILVGRKVCGTPIQRCPPCLQVDMSGLNRFESALDFLAYNLGGKI